MAVEFTPEQLVALERGYVVNSAQTGLDADGGVTIGWKVPLGAAVQCEDWMRSRRRIITDESVENQDLDGVWRSVGIGRQENKSSDRGGVYLTQTFAKGWITTLLSGAAVNWDEARLVRNTENPDSTQTGDYPSVSAETYPNAAPANNPNEYLLIRWTGIDPLLLDQVAEELRSLSELSWSPTVNGEARGSGFFRMAVIDSIDQSPNNNDRSGTIDLVLAKPRFNLQSWVLYDTPSQAKQYSFQKVPQAIAQEIVIAYNKRTGSSARVGNLDADGLIEIEITDAPGSDSDSMVSSASCRYYELTTYYHNQSTPVVSPANSMGITYDTRFDMVRSTGLYSGFITKRQRQTITIAEHDVAGVHDGTVKSKSWEGLYLNGANYQTATLAIDGGGGGVTPTFATVDIAVLTETDLANGTTVEKRVQRNDDCTYTVEIVTSDLTEVSANSNGVRADAWGIVSLDLNRHASADVAITTSPSDGSVIEKQLRWNTKTHTFDVDTSTDTATEVRKATTWVNQYGTCTHIWAINRPSGSCATDISLFSRFTHNVSPECKTSRYALEDYTITATAKSSYTKSDFTWSSSYHTYTVAVEAKTQTDDAGAEVAKWFRYWYICKVKAYCQSLQDLKSLTDSWDRGYDYSGNGDNADMRHEFEIADHAIRLNGDGARIAHPDTNLPAANVWVFWNQTDRTGADSGSVTNANGTKVYTAEYTFRQPGVWTKFVPVP